MKFDTVAGMRKNTEVSGIGLFRTVTSSSVTYLADRRLLTATAATPTAIPATPRTATPATEVCERVAVVQ